jgi:hypothetical protein
MAQAERLSSAIAPLRIGGVQNDPQNLTGGLRPSFAGLPRHSLPPMSSNHAEPIACAS